MENNENILPPGFRFHPTDEELITYYLLNKVLDSNFNSRAISEVDLNKSEPWELPEKAKMGEKEWYFYSLKDRKYPTGLRTNRATEAGYWKATGKDREIYNFKTSSLVGMKKTLVFYRGRAPKGEKSNWVMHEYRLEGKFSYHYLSRTSKDEWVIARVFKKTEVGTTTTIGGKKARSSGLMSLYNQASTSSPSVLLSPSHHLPPLLDSSYGGVNEINCSYDEQNHLINDKHVSCFSTNPNFNSLFVHHIILPPPPPTPPALPPQGDGGGGYSPAGFLTFPSLRSLHDNFSIPWVEDGSPVAHGKSCESSCELNAIIRYNNKNINM